jgi:RNA polymerase sigma factor (sigma-70 family)
LEERRKQKEKKGKDKTMDSQSVIKQYKKIAHETPKLGKQEEIDLIKKYQKYPDSDAKEKIINSYMKTVVFLAEKFSYNNSLDVLDLIQSGVCGIMTALQTFDLKQYKEITKNTGSLFAFWCYRNILSEVDKYYREHIRQVSVPFTTNNRLYKINSLFKAGKLNQFENKYGNECVKFISSTLNINSSEVKFLLTLFKPSVELDKNPEEESNHDIFSSSESNNFQSLALKDSVADYMFAPESPSKILENNEEKNNLIDKIDNLTPDERFIITSRFGINCKKQTLQQIAKKIGCSTPNVVVKTKRIQDKLKKMILSVE